MSKDWREVGVPYQAATNRYLSYPTYQTEWVDAQDFAQELTIDTYERGRSAATIWFKSPEGVMYPMFLGDFVSLVSSVPCARTGTYYGYWKFVKRGSNYGIAAV